MPVRNLRELVRIRRKLVWLSEKLVWILIDLVRHMFAISKPLQANHREPIMEVWTFLPPDVPASRPAERVQAEMRPERQVGGCSTGTSASSPVTAPASVSSPSPISLAASEATNCRSSSRSSSSAPVPRLRCEGLPSDPGSPSQHEEPGSSARLAGRTVLLSNYVFIFN